MIYDYLIVGAGLFGAAFAEQARQAGKHCLILEKRDHIAGNTYTEEIEGIQVHKYGAHIFHTNNKTVWNYVNRFAEFNRYTNSPVANYHGELYSLPFNMYTFNKMWGVITPAEAEAEILRQKKAAGITEPKNLEEQAISLVGTDIYEKLVKGYTEKQWVRPGTELPAFIIRRLPVRLTFDNNYFNSRFQGIPEEGYTAMVRNMLGDTEIRLETDYLEQKHFWDSQAEKVIYTGPVDRYFDYCYGPLQYRSVRFETEVLDTENFQGSAVINYTDIETPYTRIIEHKHFVFGKQEKTVISREYSAEWQVGDEPYYPVNNDGNNALYEKYKALADAEEKTIFGGRLGEYRYYDMDTVLECALKLAEKELVKADITLNKNMVPFDSRSPFLTSGLRVGTPAVTSRGFVEKDMLDIVELIDRVLNSAAANVGALSAKEPVPADLAAHTAVLDEVRRKVHMITSGRPLNRY